jgi:hypothetical protein
MEGAQGPKREKEEREREKEKERERRKLEGKRKEGWEPGKKTDRQTY